MRARPPVIHRSSAVLKDIKSVRPLPGDALVLDIDETVLYCGLNKYTDEVRLIDPELPERLGLLKKQGASIIFLTARRQEYRHETRQQLIQLGLDYNVLLHAHSYIDDEGNKVSTKGKVLASYVQVSRDIHRLLVVDDKQRNLDAINAEIVRGGLHAYKVITYHYKPDVSLLSCASATGFPSDLTDFVMVRALGGGTKSTYEIDRNGQRFVLKYGVSPGAMKAEILMIELYRAMGVSVPNTQVYRKVPYDLAQSLRIHPATVVQVSELLTPHDDATDKEAIKRSYIDHFIAHALLGNIDADKYDNYMARSAGADAWVLIDAGSNFQYRALGKQRKEDESIVTELKSLRDIERSPNSACWLENLSVDEINSQVDRLITQRHSLNITIWEVSHVLGIEAEEREKFIDILSQRFDYLTNGKKAAGVLTLRKKNDNEVEVLLSKRVRHEWFDCFGGKADSREDFPHAACREVREESSGVFDYSPAELAKHPYCDLKTVDQYGVRQIYRMYFAFCDESSDVSCITDHEHTEHRWIKLSNFKRSIDESVCIYEEGQGTIAVTAADAEQLVLLPAFAQLLQQAPCKLLLNMVGESEALPDESHSHSEICGSQLIDVRKHELLKAETLVKHSEVMRQLKSKRDTIPVAPYKGCAAGGGGHLVGSELTQSEMHLKVVLGDKYVPGKLRLNLEEFANTNYSEEDRQRIIFVAQKLIAAERAQADKIHFYHGCSGKIAFAYELYTAFYKILFVSDELTSFRVDNPLFHCIMNIEDFMSHFLYEGDINNYTEGYMELAISVNPFLFGNHTIDTSHSIEYFCKNTTRSEINLEVMLTSILSPFGVTADLIEEAIACFNSTQFKGQGFLYQLALASEEADKYAYLAGVRGTLNPLKQCGEECVRPSSMVKLLRGSFDGYDSYLSSLQARLMVPPKADSSLTCVRIPWNENSEHTLQRDAIDINIIAQRMAVSFLMFSKESELNVDAFLTKQFKRQLRLDGLSSDKITRSYIVKLVNDKKYDKLLTVLTEHPEIQNMIITSSKIRYTLIQRVGESKPLCVYLANEDVPKYIMQTFGMRILFKNLPFRDIFRFREDDEIACFIEKVTPRDDIYEFDNNETDQHVNTLLIYAVQYGHVKVYETLLAAGADFNAVAGNGRTLLMIAVEEGRVEMVRVLLAAGAAIDAIASEGWTALLIAANKGYVELVSALLAEKADVNAATSSGWTALMLAAEDGNYELVIKLLTAKPLVNAVSDEGYTALYNAVKNAHDRIVRVLLEAKADVNTVECNGLTALMLAAAKGYVATADLLLEAGANVDAASRDGSTAINYAARQGGVDMIVALLRAGANVNAVNNDGDSALIIAAKKVYVDVVEALLAKDDIDVNLQGADGNTALICAVNAKNIELVDALLCKQELNLDIENNDGETAEAIAERLGLYEIKKAIAQAKDDRLVTTSAKRRRCV